MNYSQLGLEYSQFKIAFRKLNWIIFKLNFIIFSFNGVIFNFKSPNLILRWIALNLKLFISNVRVRFILNLNSIITYFIGLLSIWNRLVPIWKWGLLPVWRFFFQLELDYSQFEIVSSQFDLDYSQFKIVYVQFENEIYPQFEFNYSLFELDFSN